MQASPAYFTHRPLSSYPPDSDEETEPGVFAGIFHEPSTIPERVGLWYQKLGRKSRLCVWFLVALIPLAVFGEAIYLIATGLWSVPPGLWSRDGVLTVGRDTRFHVKGASWYGMELESHCLEGLDKVSLTNVLDEVARQDLNALRIPLALDTFNRNPLMGAASLSTFANPDLASVTYRQFLKHVVERAAERNILILLDLHRLQSSKWPTDGKWIPEHLGVEGVYKFWRTLAQDFKNQWNILGADLYNEPHGAEDWKSWREFVETTGNMIHSIAPRWLIVAEGVGNLKGDPRSTNVFWAENLHPAIEDPPVLKKKAKIALSPHVYGPSVFNQSYFNDTGFPGNMPKIWDDHFGTASASGLALIVGEWGGKNVGKDALWQDAFVRYLTGKGFGHFYWCLNPGSSDTGGLLHHDWRTVDVAKAHLLERTPGTKVRKYIYHFKRKG